MSNSNSFGTIGCFVHHGDPERLFALSNRHVAIGKDSVVYFPSKTSPNAIAAMTTFDIELISDEKFQPLFDRPNAYFDVDAALIRIPNQILVTFFDGVLTTPLPRS